MTRKLFIAMVLFVLTIAGKLAFDLHLYYSGGVNNHVTGPVIVLVCLVACTWLAKWPSVFMWFLCYWILFNGFYAIFIGQNWGYLGTTSKLDIFERANGWVTPVKYVLAIGSTIFFIVKKK